MDEIKIGPSETLTLPQRCPRWTWHGDAERTGSVVIGLSERAFYAVHEHAAASDHEIGGLLLGEAFTWQDRTWVEVEVALPGEMTDAGPAHVTFTAETWSQLLRRKEREFPDKSIVGWYHSHPRMGIFLSGMDLTIQQHFFPQPWHVALVVNGQHRTAGFFAWQQEEIRKVESFVWLPAPAWEPGIAPRLGEHPFQYEPRPAAARRPASARPAPKLLPVALLVFAGVLLLLARRRSRRVRSQRR
jgi:proteasome lid subunit RPN8/RPN11